MQTLARTHSAHPVVSTFAAQRRNLSMALLQVTLHRNPKSVVSQPGAGWRSMLPADRAMMYTTLRTKLCQMPEKKHSWGFKSSHYTTAVGANNCT